MFKGNPNIAPPGSENDPDIQWIPFYRGNRLYNTHDPVRNRWKWNYKDFKPIPGEIFFDPEELRFAAGFGEGFILVEPNVPSWKHGTINKQWSQQRYQDLARLLNQRTGRKVRQFTTPSSGPQIATAKTTKPPTFRHAMAVMQRAAIYIGPEGGLHHAAAALGVPAVVIFGSWIPPEVTGYDFHTNIARGEACGNLFPCPHCQEAMKTITLREVFDASMKILRGLPKPMPAAPADAAAAIG